MSVIVKNMELPESCGACRFLVGDDFEDTFECTALREFMDEDELPKGRRSDCPLVDEEPVRHGKWRFVDCATGLRCQCSECLHWVDAGTDRNYCPNCGAKMDKDD